METFSFGDTPDMADQLLELVMTGKKTATCWAVTKKSKENVPGKQMIVTDGEGKPRAIIETVECVKTRFKDVDKVFAYDEGEGDQTLEYWRKEHRDFFTREGTYSDDMGLYCERFKLVRVLE